MSDWYRQQITFKAFLLYGDVPQDQVSDPNIHDAVVRILRNAVVVNHVVCLVIHPVYDRNGVRRPEASNVWVDNEYVLKLQADVGDNVLFGASVHLYAPDFAQRVADCVNKGAVLLKWIPSAQQFSLGDDRVGQAMKFLATAKGGKPLPLLLHCGPEYAIPSTDSKTWTFDFISWSLADRLKNVFADHGVTRAWKGQDWDAMNRLHEKGMISDPRNKAKSVK